MIPFPKEQIYQIEKCLVKVLVPLRAAVDKGCNWHVGRAVTLDKGSVILIEEHALLPLGGPLLWPDKRTGSRREKRKICLDGVFVITPSCDFLGTSIYGAPPPCLPRV